MTGAELALARDLSQFIAKALSLRVSALSLSAMLHGRDTSHRVEDVRHGSALAMPDMFELIRVVILVNGMCLCLVYSQLEGPVSFSIAELAQWLHR